METPVKETPVKKAWFIDAIHDLYYGLWLIGPFASKKDAEKHEADKPSKGFDEVNIKELNYVEFDGHCYPLVDAGVASPPGEQATR